LLPEVVISNDKNAIKMRTYAGNRWIEVSLEGDCNGINPGDTFISPNDGIKSMIIGFEPGLVWALKKDGKRIGCFSAEGETIRIIKTSLIKAESLMTAETAAGTIDNFQNS
jgi:hypothetical protein